MTYLLSLLKGESPSREELPLEKELNSLCYYVNNAKFVQNIQVITNLGCILEHLVFPKERMLFEAPSEAHIQVSTFLLDRVKTIKFECQRLRIAEECNSDNALH